MFVEGDLHSAGLQGRWSLAFPMALHKVMERIQKFHFVCFAKMGLICYFPLEAAQNQLGFRNLR